MHPSVRRKLQHYFAAANQRLFSIMGKEYMWGEWMREVADEEEGGIPIIPTIHANQGSGRSTFRAIASAGKVSKPPIPELLPGVVFKSSSIPRKESSSLVKRVVSISARV
jgi:hypothetical protein